VNLGMDCGTMFVVGARRAQRDVEITRKRNCFVLIKGTKFNRQMLTQDPNIDWIPWEDGQIALVGDSALEYANSNPTSMDVRRPLSRGILNKKERDAYPMLRAIVESVASKGRGNCTLSIPAPTIDCEYLIDHHKDVLLQILRELGWTVDTVHEGYCVVLSALAKSRFTGIGISFGGGMVNVSFSFLADELFSFSMQQSGDWVDQVAADASGFSRAEITDMKENEFSLDNNNIGRDGLWQIESAYNSLIDATAKNIKAAFDTLERPPRVKEPLQIAIAGGTSMVPGFVKRFEERFKAVGFPIPIGDVFHVQDPLYAVAKGALLHAEASSDEDETSSPAKQPEQVTEPSADKAGSGDEPQKEAPQQEPQQTELPPIPSGFHPAGGKP